MPKKTSRWNARFLRPGSIGSPIALSKSPFIADLLFDSNVEKELNVKETKPLLNELTSLLASSYNVEKYSYLATCGQLPANQAVRDRLIDQAIERKLARNPNYSATKSLVRILEKQQMQGGVLLVARE